MRGPFPGDFAVTVASASVETVSCFGQLLTFVPMIS